MLFPGIFFEAVENDRFRIRLTRRVDLSRSRLSAAAGNAAAVARDRREAKRSRGKRPPSVQARPSAILAAIATSTPNLSRKLRRVLERLYGEPGMGSTIACDRLSDILWRCRTFGFEVWNFENAVTPKFRKSDPMVEQWVEDPSMSKAEKLHRLDKNPGNKRVGQVKATVRLASQIGGLSRVKLGDAQRQGAARFRDLAERAQIGGARAIDLTAVRVDTSGPVAGREVEIGVIARAEYEAARERLGDLNPFAECVIVEGGSVSACAARIGLGSGGTARQKASSLAVEVADRLAVHFGFKVRRYSLAKPSHWSDGTKARIIRDDTEAAA